MNEIQTLPEDLMLVFEFESTGIYSKPVEIFYQKTRYVIVY